MLIIGGGDGGALRHVLMHKTVKHAVMVEIDGMVVDVCREYLPGLSGGAFDDPRTELIIGDGAKYLAETNLKFDAIVVDSTDPIGAAEVLFSEQFFSDARRVLRKRGVYTMQCGSPVTMPVELGRTYRRFGGIFPITRVYLGTVVGYPGVLWAYLTGSQRTDPSAIKRSRLERRTAGIDTQYYTPAMHRAAFALPARMVAALNSPTEERIGFLPRNPALSGE